MSIGSFIQRLSLEHPEFFRDFDEEEFLSDHRNTILEDSGDIAIFQYIRPGVYQGHYFFESRGKKALERARGFLKEFWKKDVDVIEGLTPTFCRGAQVFSRLLGFQSFGIVETPNGECELFIMTRDQFNKVSSEWVS